MIIDKIENADLYKGISEGLKIGFEYLEQTNLEETEVGKYDLEGGVKAIVSEYQTKDEKAGVIEAHKKFIDIQFIVKGEEKIGFFPLYDEMPTTPYNTEKDVMFFTEPVSYTKLGAGMFAVFFPTDVHQPNIRLNDSILVKKVVVKVPV